MLKGLYGSLVRFIGIVLKITVAGGGYISVNGKRIYAFATALAANVTTTAPEGSIAFTTHATGIRKVFVSDGAHWQEFGVLAYTPGAHVNLTGSALVDNSGGTAGGTLQAVGAGYVQAVAAGNTASLAAGINKNTADIAAIKASLEASGVLASS